jgi:hypothetical protein
VQAAFLQHHTQIGNTFHAIQEHPNMKFLPYFYHFAGSLALSLALTNIAEAAPKAKPAQQAARAKAGAQNAKPPQNAKPAQNAKTGRDAKPAQNAKPAQSSKTPANSRSNNDKSRSSTSSRNQRNNNDDEIGRAARQAANANNRANSRSNNDKSRSSTSSRNQRNNNDDEIGRAARQAANANNRANSRGSTPPRARRNDDEIGQIARQAGSGSTTSRTENTARNNDDEIGQIARQSSVTASPPPAVSSSAGRGDVDDLIGSAMGFLGVAYRFGGASPSGFDCSGFMQYIFRKAFAVNLPRTSAEQANVGVAVNRSQLQPGDMVFFRTAGSRISHVGMYIGNDRFIHAPRTGKRIEITSLSNRYWSARYATARRVKRQNAQNFIRN